MQGHDAKRRRRRTAGRVVAGGLCLALLWAGCDSGGTGEEPEPTGPGSLVETALLETVDTGRIAAMNLPVSPRYDVEIHRILYRTVDPHGRETTASGALMRPRGTTGALPLVSYQHGTVVRKDDVASARGLDVPEALVGVLFATSGYLAVMPDYLGLGASEGLHPYVHAASLATSVVDMLRAARHFAEREGIPLDEAATGRPAVFLTGYSEGGFATVAAQRLLEGEQATAFHLVASAPMAGNYDMSGTMADLMLRREPYPAPFFLPYTLLAYDAVYDLFDDLSEAFVAPYDQRLPALFDGTRSGSEIDAELPAIPIEMVRSDYLTGFLNDTNHPLRQALRDNDLYAWAPRTPTRLYHCEADELVPFANTEVAAANFIARGAPAVEVVRLDVGGHVACAGPALFLAWLWFETFRTAKDGLPATRPPTAQGQPTRLPVR
ncbi:lipase family protein [Rhodocaloribacter litoris]|uniref:lipase family protein n=1 Tax=Rhodocaloribacter litoris TaxID=2558931 RepID=UPI001424138B|nr:lipase family protein [Rhodocaloribacter litoris]QXD16640.1 lipase family protein [Rhodocaloribacter litoris]